VPYYRDRRVKPDDDRRPRFRFTDDLLLETYAPSAPKTMIVRNIPMNRRLERSVALEPASKESIFASFHHP
jgi:hypothetical protein